MLLQKQNEYKKFTEDEISILKSLNTRLDPENINKLLFYKSGFMCVLSVFHEQRLVAKAWTNHSP